MDVFDAHLHIIDPRYTLTPNQGYVPLEFTTKAYRNATKGLNIRGGAVVSGSFQGTDQEYLKNILLELGDGYYGVANLPTHVSDSQIRELSTYPVCAARFNRYRGSEMSPKYIRNLSSRLYQEFGWHSELYVASQELPALRATLSRLDYFSIDHLGVSKEGQKELYYWVEKGAKIKATGFGRVDFDPIEAMRMIHRINPEALMFGTDLPSTRAKRPFSLRDVDLISTHFAPDDQRRIFHLNALNFYSTPKI